MSRDRDGVGHNIDFHAVTGPGGGAPVLYAEEGETKVGVGAWADFDLWLGSGCRNVCWGLTGSAGLSSCTSG